MLRPQLLQAIPNGEEFLRFCETKEYAKGKTILREGEKSEKLYLILDGSVTVMVEDEQDQDHKMVVSYLNLGDFFGESHVPARCLRGNFGPHGIDRGRLALARCGIRRQRRA